MGHLDNGYVTNYRRVVISSHCYAINRHCYPIIPLNYPVLSHYYPILPMNSHINHHIHIIPLLSYIIP